MPDSMTREQILQHAYDAAAKAKDLAGRAESAAHSTERRGQTPHFAAAGALWADVARSYAAIAHATPAPVTEATDA